MGRDAKAFIAFLALGVMFLILGVTAKNFLQFSAAKVPMGLVYEESGEVFLYKKDFRRKDFVTSSLPVYMDDRVETSDAGIAKIVFDSGSAIRVLPRSLVKLKKELLSNKSKLLVVIEKGSIETFDPKKLEDLWIEKNDSVIEASAYSQSALAREVPQAALDAKNQTPSEEEIFKTVNQSKNSFFKCYTQLLAKNPSLKGNVVLNFTVEARGKVSSAHVTSSFSADSDFSQCLIEIIMRTQFKSFEGEPLQISFPFKFE